MDRRRFLRTVSYGLSALVLAPTRALAAPPVLAVVCHPSAGVVSLTRAQLQPIYRMRSQQYPGGGRVIPVNLASDHPGRHAFDRVVLGLEPDEIERFWIDSKIRSGVGSPRSLSTPATVAHWVASERSALGYVPAADAGAGSGLRIVALVRDGVVVPS